MSRIVKQMTGEREHSSARGFKYEVSVRGAILCSIQQRQSVTPLVSKTVAPSIPLWKYFIQKSAKKQFGVGSWASSNTIGDCSKFFESVSNQLKLWGGEGAILSHLHSCHFRFFSSVIQSHQFCKLIEANQIFLYEQSTVRQNVLMERTLVCIHNVTAIHGNFSIKW